MNTELIAWMLVSAILGVLLGTWLGKMYSLADPDEPKRDAAGKRGELFIPERNGCTLVEGFEPPIWSGTTLHEYKRGHPENRYCCECGAGEFHAVHANPTERNKEMWERIQKGGSPK